MLPIVKVLLLVGFLQVVSGEKCKFGTVAEGKTGSCKPFTCSKPEECMAHFGEESSKCLPDGRCACSSPSLIVDEDQRCSNKTMVCKFGHCPDNSACYKGGCFCNVGHFGLELNGQLSCVTSNCTDTPGVCQAAFGEHSECVDASCDCKQMYYWDVKNRKCSPQMDMTMGLSVAGVFVVIIVAPVVIFNILV